MANYGPTELQCEATIIEAARRFGWLVHGERPARAADGSYSTPIKGDPGWPDLVLVRNGELIVRELKRLGNKPTQAQLDWLAALRLAGVDAEILVVPKDMDRFIEWLARR